MPSRSASVFALVDVVLLTLKNDRLHVALFRRDKAPALGQWALPGGGIFEDEDEDVSATAERVLREKAGLRHSWLEQLRVFSGRKRDDRGWSLSVAHYALVPLEVLEKSSKAGDEMRLVDVGEARGLPFDHDEIIAAAVERVRSKSTYSSIAAHLLPREFTIAQLHATYEAVLGEPINMASFRRKIGEMDFVEPIEGQMLQEGRMRPAQAYRLKSRFRRELNLRSRGLAG